MLALDLDEASVKVRTGPPADDDSDITAARAWAGVLPLRTEWGVPQPDPELPGGMAVPPHVARRGQTG